MTHKHTQSIWWPSDQRESCRTCCGKCFDVNDIPADCGYFLTGPKQLLSYVPMNIVLLKKKDNCCIPERRFYVECSMSIASQGLASAHDQLRAVCPTPLIKLASWAYERCKIECVLEGVFLYLAYISMDFCYSVSEFYCLNYRKWYEWRKMGNMQIYVYLYQFIKYIYTFVLEFFMSVTFHC